jgi:site-specific DNA-methyltransferase (adenine-specific)/modification methylase
MKNWESGGIQLYLGDCLEILPALESGGVDAVVTDPPYGVNGGVGGQAIATKKAKYQTTQWDDTPEYILAHVVPVISLLKQWNIPMAVTTGNRCLHFYPTPDNIGCFWTPAAANRGPWGFTTFNPILYYGKDWRAGRGPLPSGTQVTERAKVDGFPCPKPIKAWTWLVDKVCSPSGTVLDPFMGSGTTGVACVQTGRKFIGIEIDPGYFEIAKKRIMEAQSQIRLPGLEAN